MEVVSAYGQFPTQEIFKKVKDLVISDGVKNSEKIKILTPDEYLGWISAAHENNKLNWNSTFPGAASLYYAQRDYLGKWENLDDLDKDHIIPYNWMNFSGPSGSDMFWHVSTVDTSGRSPVINSPGNFRFWPSSLNRAYQDSDPSSKHIHFEDNSNLDEIHVQRHLSSVRDVLDASFIDDEELELIHKIEVMIERKEHRVWTTERYKLFKQLVDLRCVKMYRNLYETLRFDEL